MALRCAHPPGRRGCLAGKRVRAQRRPTPPARPLRCSALPAGHHCVGAGGIVVNARGCVLGIRERFDRSGLWHVPGGHVDEGEELLAAGAREAREETGVACVPLGIASWYELHVPVPLPPGHGPPTADDRSKQEQSRRFGSTHVGAYVVCVATDDTLAPDAGEIAEARWLPVDEFLASGHEEAACQIATMQRNGTIEALAKLAAALKAAGGAASSDASATQPLAALYEQATRHLSHAVRVTSRHKRYPEGTYDSVHYSPLPHAQLASAIAGCKRTVAVQVLAPPELAGVANAGVTAPPAAGSSSGSGAPSGICAASAAATAAPAPAGEAAAPSPSSCTSATAAGTLGGALLFAAGVAAGVLLAKRLRW